jgi:hypothetical protein
MAAMTTFNMPTVIKTPDKTKRIAARVKNDFGAFCFDGFGVMLSDDQLECRNKIGAFGPRERDGKKYTFLSGGQRGGKTVFLGLQHADGGLYKRGVDPTDRRWWRNYQYKLLAIAPTTDLVLKLWSVMDELSKGVSDAQYDRRARRSRGGAFIGMLKAAKLDKWPVVHYEWGGRSDFRSAEGYAFRLEGDQWWGITYDEWASQPDREIDFVLKDVLLGRARDHDAKILPAAWPKAQTERHLIKVIRDIEAGNEEGENKQVVYLRADQAHFTNQTALAVERKVKDDAMWKRTVLGEPAGGASIEFPSDVVANMLDGDIKLAMIPEEDDHKRYRYFSSWDIGMAHDETVGLTWQIPRVGVTIKSKARIVHAQALKSGAGLTLDHITYSIQSEQALYRSQSALDATGLGGIATVRQLRNLKPSPLSFIAKSNDRIYGNMRLAAIANGLELLTWGRTDDEMEPWGVIESPPIVQLTDQMANFDRDAKGIPDDWVWAFLIGLWYIRRYWLQGGNQHRERQFDQRIVRQQQKFWKRGR